MRNNNYLIIIIILILLLLLTACNKKLVNSDKDLIIDPDTEPILEEPLEIVEVDKIQEKLDFLTLDEKIGQLLIVGFEDSIINDYNIKMIEEYKVGGFILFSRNIIDENQLLDLVNNLKVENKDNSVPLFISIDEEGGKVSRLPNTYKKLPESKSIGESNDPDLSYEYGQLLGNRLKLLGINLNFAPVLDINSNPNNPVIGNRSFGNTEDLVVNNGIPLFKGIESTGVIPAVKHFPGHGDTHVDSHISLPIVYKTLDELEELELKPFKRAIEEDVDVIMVAHILFPELDDIYPATMSKSILMDLLRRDLGYNGVIISDDITMGAILENYSIELASLNFLKAGGDIVLICHGEDNPIAVIQFIKDSINNGNIRVEDIDEKVYRILALKEKYNLEDNIIDSIDLENINKQTEELRKKILQ